LAYKPQKAIVAIKVALVRNNIRKDEKLVPVIQTSKPLARRQPSILDGADGRVQGRKLAAWICFSLLFWGLVTIQNVVQLGAT